MPCINNAETVGILSYFIEFLNLPYTKNGGLNYIVVLTIKLYKGTYYDIRIYTRFNRSPKRQ